MASPSVQFAAPIHSIARSLDALRDFLDVLDTFLSGKTDEAIREHGAGVAPLFLAMYRAGYFASPAEDVSLPEGLLDNVVEKLPSVQAIEIGDPDERGRRSISFKSPPGEELTTALDVLGKATTRTRMLYSSALMNLTSAVELFFSRLLHIYFELHPEAIGTKEKLFSFEDLAKFDSVADARSHYVLSKVEDLLRGPFDDWLSFLRTQVKMSMGYLKGDQATLSEVFRRRNVIVHNGGLANAIYLNKVPEQLRGGVRTNDDLNPTRSYLHDRVDLFERNCVLVGAELWKHLRADDNERAGLLLELAYQHLRAKRYALTKSFSYFVVNDKQAPESTRTVAQLNLWLAEKRLGNWDKVRGEAISADFTAKGLRFQVGHAALVEDAQRFFSLVPKALQAGDINLDELMTFPILEEMRADQRFYEIVAHAAASAEDNSSLLPSTLADDVTGASAIPRDA